MTDTAPVENFPFITTHEIEVLRLDKLHPITGGNKVYKLRHNLRTAKEMGLPVVTFGGAHSNHIAAAAMACKTNNVEITGLIRGPVEHESSTLNFARAQDMKIRVVDRNEYAKKNQAEYLRKLKDLLGPFYLIPEGGANEAGMKGCAEIIPPDWHYDYILCACGTATTYGGLLLSHGKKSKVIGVSVLKGKNTLPEQVRASFSELRGFTISGDEAMGNNILSSHAIISSYAFSGFARYNQQLIDFKRKFEISTGIILDHVYTVKLFFALYDLCNKMLISPGSSVLVIHSGGLQGNVDFERLHRSKLDKI